MGLTTVWTYQGQYEHICSVATWLTYQGQDCSTLIRLGHWSSLWIRWLINPPTQPNVQVFCLQYCVRPLYSSRLPLSLIGGKWGESRSQHTLEYIWYTHQQEGEHGSWNSISLTKQTQQRRFRSATTTKKKSTTVEADTKPASSLSNGIDNVPQDFHFNTFLTHRKEK